MNKVLVLVFYCLLSLQGWCQSQWKIDATKSKIKFTIDGPFGLDVDGALSSPTGFITFDISALAEASFNVSVDANTIFTDNHKRDDHLRKPEFFDVVKYKNITFTSTKIEKVGSGYVATGILRIKDKTKSVKIPFTFTKTGNIGSWKGNFTINRVDYNVGTSSVMMGEEALISIEVIALPIF